MSTLSRGGRANSPKCLLGITWDIQVYTENSFLSQGRLMGICKCPQSYFIGPFLPFVPLALQEVGTAAYLMYF